MSRWVRGVRVSVVVGVVGGEWGGMVTDAAAVSSVAEEASGSSLAISWNGGTCGAALVSVIL